jgi:phosphatidylglycerophosphate synthase
MSVQMANDTLPITKAPMMAPRSATRAQMQGAALGLVLTVLVFFLARALDPAQGLGATLGAAGLFLIAGAAALHAMGVMGYARHGFGAPNVVTFVRLALVCSLSIGLVRGDLLAESGLAVFVIAVLALSLDGLDGWLARRDGVATAFGARFDMEVDAALSCMLSLILLISGHVGPEIMILGFSRYAFIAAGMVLPWLRAPLTDLFSRKVVCVFQIGALCLLLLPAVPEGLARGISLCAAGLLLWSFGRDIVDLARRR